MPLILNGSTGISGIDGSAGTPSYQGTDSNTGIFYPAADTIAFAEGGTEVMRIDSAGDVGIGTTNPLAKFEVHGQSRFASSASSAVLLIDAAATSTDGVDIQSSYYGGAGYGPMKFSTGGSERMRINSSGEVSVGTTNASGSAGVGAKILSTTGGFTFAQVTDKTTNADHLAYNYYSTGAAAYRFYVGAAGTVYATNTTITAISDQRLKENIQDIDVGLNKIIALKPRKFDWKEGKGKNIKGDRGWIAQEFEQVFPEMIDEWRDPAPEGEEPYKAVNADLIPVLVKAIQELNAKVEAQAAEIAALKAK